MGLRTKLLSIWFVLLLAPLTILGGIGYAYISKELREQTLDYRSDLLLSVAASANGYLSRLRLFAWAMARNEGMAALVESDREVPEQLLADLKSTLDAYPPVQGFWWLSAAAASSPQKLLSRGGRLTDISRPAELPDAEGGVDIRYRPGSDPRAGQLVSYAPVLHEGRVAGYLITAFSQDSLEELLPIGERGTHLFFMNSDGGVVGTQNLEFSRLEALPAILPDAGSNSRSRESYALGDRRYMLAIQRLDHGLWAVSLTDHQVLLAKKLPYIIVFATTLAMILLLSGVVFNLIVNRVAIEPIQKLIRATRQITKGDLKPELDIRSEDELGELAGAFRQMGQQLLHTSRRIRQLAYYDPLTQLPNRTTLRETLNRLLARARRDKWKVAVLFIDLDDFKKVNDRLGHEAGDELLVQISHRLKNRLRQADIVFEKVGIGSVEQLISRRGGDEFNAILTDLKAPHDAALVAERIIQDLNEPFFVGKSEIHVGASVGVAFFPDDGEDADTLLRNADLAMYEAKNKGKNSYHIFTSAINEQVHQRLALENSLQLALVQNQFRLYYQPKVSLVDMSPVGFEALIRWKHPEKGIILPSKFIPVAEESNLIRDIGNWILGESMQQIQLWDKLLPPHLRIAINISARQLAQTDLVDQLRMMIDHFEISPRRLEVELTETSVLQDEMMAVQHLSDLRRLGIEISLDDFGTGYSSLSFLRKLPIDTVKIDRSFTANVTHNAEARAIVVSLLGLCRQLQVNTIAEGIETTEQLQFLMEHGCDQGQGFLFSKPIPAHQVMSFLEEPSYLALSEP